LESCIGAYDLGEAIKAGAEASSVLRVWEDAGAELRKFHQLPVRAGTAGTLASIDDGHLSGSVRGEWADWISKDLRGELKVAADAGGVTGEDACSIMGMLRAAEPWLCRVSQPCALHMDLSPSNIRVDCRADGSDLRMAGLIDFADVMIGDPLLDVAQVLADQDGDEAVFQATLMGYCGGHVDSKYSSAEARAATAVYAIWCLLWRTSGEAKARGTVSVLTRRWKDG
jgi:aminoglycoside phosphotransferase (APT) family kinase protein